MLDRSLAPLLCSIGFIAASLAIGVRNLCNSRVRNKRIDMGNNQNKEENYCACASMPNNKQLENTIKIITIASLCFLALSLVGWVPSPYTLLWLLPPLYLYILVSHKSKGLLAIIDNNSGPIIFVVYCLWLTIASSMNQGVGNIQVLYYLWAGGLALGTAVLIQKKIYRNSLIYAVAICVCLTTWQRQIGSDWIDLKLAITYKNYVATTGLMVLCILLSLKSSIATNILRILVSLALLFNPSVLGQVGVAIILVTWSWMKLPKLLNKLKQENGNSQSPQKPPTYYIILSAALAIMAVLTIFNNLSEISSLLEKNDNLNGRLEIWKTGLLWIKEAPLFGHGPRFWFENGGIAVSNLSSLVPTRAYNGLIDTACQSGIPATLLVLFLIGASLINTRIKYDHRLILLLGVGLSITTETHSIFGVPPDMGEVMIAIWLAYAWSNTKFLPQASKRGYIGIK